MQSTILKITLLIVSLGIFCGCQEELPPFEPQAKEVEVLLGISTSDINVDTDLRAIAAPISEMRYVVEVYHKDSVDAYLRGELPSIKSVKRINKVSDYATSSSPYEIKMNLPEGDYRFVVWSHFADNEIYNVESLQNIRFKGDVPTHYLREYSGYTFVGDMTIKEDELNTLRVVLKNALGQVEFRADDIKNVTSSNQHVSRIVIQYDNFCSAYNAVTQRAFSKTKFTRIIDNPEYIINPDADSLILHTGMLFTSKVLDISSLNTTRINVDIMITLSGSPEAPKHNTITDVALNQNFKSLIYGNLLTNNID